MEVDSVRLLLLLATPLQLGGAEGGGVVRVTAAGYQRAVGSLVVEGGRGEVGGAAGTLPPHVAARRGAAHRRWVHT